MFDHGQTLPIQFLWGGLFGSLAGAVSLLSLLKLTIFKELRNLFQNIITEVDLNIWGICFISLNAGISEEILFRGVMQPFMGIWWSSLLFIGLHGYFTPRSWRVSLYGLLMFAVSVGLGFLCEWYGLMAAICAHTVVDIVILWGLRINLQYIAKN